jgi:hypothetical protein
MDEREKARAQLRDTLVGWVGGNREGTELKLDALDRYLDARAGADPTTRIAELEAALKDCRRIRADDLAHLAKVDRESDAWKSGAVSMKVMAEQACKERDEAVARVAELERENACVTCQERIARIETLEGSVRAYGDAVREMLAWLRRPVAPDATDLAKVGARQESDIADRWEARFAQVAR